MKQMSSLEVFMIARSATNTLKQLSFCRTIVPHKYATLLSNKLPKDVQSMNEAIVQANIMNSLVDNTKLPPRIRAIMHGKSIRLVDGPCPKG